MSEVMITPRIRCDNCGHTEDKVRRTYAERDWMRPQPWGSVKAEGTVKGAYPQYIAMTDLCEKCTKLVYEAVGDALAAGRKEPA